MTFSQIVSLGSTGTGVSAGFVSVGLLEELNRAWVKATLCWLKPTRAQLCEGSNARLSCRDGERVAKPKDVIRESNES